MMRATRSLAISRSKEIPLYLQIKEDIRKKILSKEWKDGARIPGETELCSMYAVSRITVRKALEDLQSEHYLVKYQGRGTYVNKTSIEQRLSKFYSFSEELKEKGMQEFAAIVAFSKIEADEELTQSLRCQPGEDVFRIERIRYTESKPYIVETSYIPVRFVPKLTAEMVQSQGLYTTLRTMHVYPDSATERFSAINLTQKLALMLGVREHDAAIALQRITYSSGNVIEYCVSFVRGDFFSYTVELN